MEATARYQPYSHQEIDVLMNEPWEVSDQPFKLHAAYALSCLYETFAEADYDDEEESPDDNRDCIWGMKVGKKMLDRLVADVMCDFNDAADNYKSIKIWGKNYRIRKVNSYDHKRLGLIFRFPEKDGEYTITKDGVLNLYGITPDSLKSYEVSKEHAKDNRTYLRQIIKLAEDDEHNGWDKLTDMEVAVYCWALYYNKYQFDNFVQFQKLYKDYIYVSVRDMEKCFNEQATLRHNPNGMYTFSHEKVSEWNRENNQLSEAENIPSEEAEDYWYEVALKTTFKPIDHKQQ
ncbi:MAG: hypothetical protein ACI4Q6_03810 [Huintestinicola sp.]